jgi:hypothetical protein
VRHAPANGLTGRPPSATVATPSGDAYTVLVAAAGVAIAVLLLDAVFFRPILPNDYVAAITELSPSQRLLYYVPRALAEEILYRLGVMSALSWLLLKGLPAAMAYWITIATAQLINIATSVPPPTDIAVALYDGLRFFAPGVVWGYIYWKKGFAADASAHVATHLILQPLIGFAVH